MGFKNEYITTDKMKKCISEALATRKTRKFPETIDLQIGLKDYDPNKDKRFAGTVKLPHIPRPKLKVCVIADANHMDKCKVAGIDNIDADTLKKRVSPETKKEENLKNGPQNTDYYSFLNPLLNNFPKWEDLSSPDGESFPLLSCPEMMSELKLTMVFLQLNSN